MADEQLQERTERPTPKRLDDARTKGQVPRSKEVTSALVLLAGAVVAGPVAARVAVGILDIYRYVTTSPMLIPTQIPELAVWLQALMLETLGLMAAPLLLMAGVVATVGGLQARGILSLEPIKPQWSRLSPLQNGKRILGVQSVAELLKSVGKLVIVGLAVYTTMAGTADELMALAQQSAGSLLTLAHHYAPRILMSAAFAYLILAAADYLFQIWQHDKSLRMTREEIKRERKETEGDMLVKARMRSMGRAMTRNRMIAQAAEADVVITNPTHIAVALKYDPEVAPAPLVLAMGQRKIAQRIKQIALENGIPVIEDRPLARALFGAAKVGTVIPVELYVAVAEVLAFVFRQRERARASMFRRGVAQ